MSHYISDCGEFVVRTVFIKVDDCFNNIIGKWKVLFCDVLFSPELDLIVWIHVLCFSIKILLCRW